MKISYPEKIFLFSALCLTVCTISRCRKSEYRIAFVPVFAGKTVDCRSKLRIEGGAFQFKDLRFFVHGLQLGSADRFEDAEIFDKFPSQAEHVAFIDLESGPPDCEGDAHIANQIFVRAPATQYDSIRFKVGVPFALNHRNPESAAAPLNIGQMHWSWQSGYKHFRLEGFLDGKIPIVIHLGSTGCHGEMFHITGCDHANIAEVTITSFHASTNKIAIDIAALVDPLLAAARRHHGISCKGSPDNSACGAVYRALGVGGTQNVFSRL